jgi:hypothetical protein
MKKLLFLILINLSLNKSFAQNQINEKEKKNLIDISLKFAKEEAKDKEEVNKFIKEKNLIKKEVYKDGTVIELQTIEAGMPIYNTTYNEGGAITSSAFSLFPDQIDGLRLTGKNLRVGVWDAGKVFSDHIELKGRIIIMDESSIKENHSTHVAGTIGATGITKSARGMANNSTILSFDWNSDLSEMAAEAAEGLLISNHSYGNLTGWNYNSNEKVWYWYGNPSVDPKQDYKFGYYSNLSRNYDIIANNAPYYLIVKAAGNDRNENPPGGGTEGHKVFSGGNWINSQERRDPDGQYDCISGPGISKNTLTIGAVNQVDNYTGATDVTMSNFSSWGPTDDGRIKPDLVTKGVGVFSTTATGVSNYTTLNGTSMAAPVATGSLLLLQEHYHSFKGEFMRAATLKGLAIHCADEAGDFDGPDYSFGWGLLNVSKAANLITKAVTQNMNYRIIEGILKNEESLEYNIYSDGKNPLLATISWTDLPASPAPISLNPKKLMLVNDLDIKVLSEKQEEFLPWILDPDNPANPAQKGDNFRDNIEKIEIIIPEPGNYKIVVSHKGSLSNNLQNFSLIISSGTLNSTLNTLYWVGKDGDWNDTQNWSFTSGGTPSNTLPDFKTKVIFDANSFLNSSESITIKNDVQCYSMEWKNNQNASLVISNSTLFIDGSINLTGKMKIEGDGKIEFLGNLSKKSNINLNKTDFSKISFIINSSNGLWELSNDLHAKSLLIKSGNFNSEKNSINLKSLITENTVSLNIEGSTVSIRDEFLISNQTSLLAKESKIILGNSENLNEKSKIIADNKELSIIEVIGNEAEIFGNLKLNHLNLKRNTFIAKSIYIDSLEIDRGINLSLNNSIILTTTKINFKEDKDFPITLKADSEASINVPINKKICLNNFIIENVNATGKAAFSSGNSLLIGNSEGWKQGNCEELLFADFNVSNLCYMALTDFTNESSGEIKEYVWSFSSINNGLQVFSNNKDVEFQFPEAGLYNIKLEIKNGNEVRAMEKEIEIINDLHFRKPIVILDGENLASSTISTNYLWYYNDHPIPDSNKRFLTPTENGIYKVQVINETCNYFSDPFNYNLTNTIITELSSHIKVYPNPTSGKLVIEVGPQNHGDLEVVVINGAGKVVIFQKFKDESIVINMDKLPKGFYYLNLKSTESVHHLKVIKN